MPKVVVGNKYLGSISALYCTECGMLTAPAKRIPMQHARGCEADEEYHAVVAKCTPAGYVIEAQDYL